MFLYTKVTRRPRRRLLRASVVAAAVAMTIAAFAASAEASSPMYFGGSFTSACAGTYDWASVTDGNGLPEVYTPSEGAHPAACDYADYDIPSGSGLTCDWYLWVPNVYGNATVIPGVYTSTGQKYYGPRIDESQYDDQWAYIGTYSDVAKINIGANDGQTGTYVGLGSVIGVSASNCHEDGAG